MKACFIFVTYKTPNKEIERLKSEVKSLGLKEYELYFIDNTIVNRGYAAGANIGLKKGLEAGCEIFIVANPDISLKKINKSKLLDGAKHFDIWGYAMYQDKNIFYGGNIDKWRMSGGLINVIPNKRFINVDFPSGSLILFKKKVIDKIGFWDESYFLYYEEVDYCYRAKKAGFKVGIDSRIAYEHFEVSKTNLAKEFYLFKNRIKFMMKYGSLKQKLREIFRLPKTIFEEIKKRPFYLNFFSLNFSSLVNKALHLVLFLIMVRTFIPEDYAIYTLAWTQIGLFLPILDFGTTSYGLVYLPEQKESNFISLFSFRIVLSILTLILTLIISYLFHYPSKVFFAIILTSIVIIANSFSGSYLIYTSIKEKSYLVSIVSMIFQIVLVLILISVILLTKNLLWVFYSIFILYGLYAFINFILLKVQIKSIKFKIDISNWIKISKKSIIFLIISLFAGFYSKSDVLILNFLKGQKEVGLYSAGYKFLDALMFIITAYNVSAIPMFSRFIRTNKKDLFILKIKKDIILLSLIGFGVAFFVLFFSPIIMPFLLKSNYYSSIKVLQIIIFALPLILLTSVSLNSLYALKKANTVVFLFLFQIIFNISMNFIFIPKFSYMASSWITIIGEIINTTIAFIILKKAINENFS